jgi:hypothetical protein
MLYVHYDGIAKHYPGWNLTEIKRMPAREREFWVALIKWRIDRNG